jgi:hypothetical protein
MIIVWRLYILIFLCIHGCWRSHWPCGLRRRYTAARLLRLWFRIPMGAWMFFCCKCCVFSGRGLCDELISYPEESNWLWCVFACDLETSWMRSRWSIEGCRAKYKHPPPNATTCPLRLRGLPPPWLWLKCNRLLKLGRPVGAVTLSRWEWWWNERWVWGARGGLKPNFYQLPRPWSPWASSPFKEKRTW